MARSDAVWPALFWIVSIENFFEVRYTAISVNPLATQTCSGRFPCDASSTTYENRGHTSYLVVLHKQV